MNTAVLAAAISILAAAQGADVGLSAAHAPTGTLCLDALGENRGPVCRVFSASRIDARPDICQCLSDTLQVDTPYCAAGETPQVPTHAFKLARRAAALKGGTLVGQSYNGRSYCIAPPFSRAP